MRVLPGRTERDVGKESLGAVEVVGRRGESAWVCRKKPPSGWGERERRVIISSAVGRGMVDSSFRGGRPAVMRGRVVLKFRFDGKEVNPRRL